MNTVKQPTLFDAQKPACVTVNGQAMIDAIRELKERGAHVSGMASVNNSGWRLTIEWPNGHGNSPITSRKSFPVNPTLLLHL
jgi:hypothetical protein